MIGLETGPFAELPRGTGEDILDKAECFHSLIHRKDAKGATKG
jgi:hypothetical protein